MKNTDKVTLTFGQLKKLIKESKTFVKESIELIDSDKNKQLRIYKMTPDDIIGAWTGTSLHTSPNNEILNEIEDNGYFDREANKYFGGDMRKLVKFLKAHKDDSIVVKQFPNPKHDDYWHYKETFKIGGIPFIGYGIQYFDEEDIPDSWFYDGDEEDDEKDDIDLNTWEGVFDDIERNLSYFNTNGKQSIKGYAKGLRNGINSGDFNNSKHNIGLYKRLLDLYNGKTMEELRQKYIGEIPDNIKF